MTDWQKMWAEIIQDTSEPPEAIRKLTDAALQWMRELETARENFLKYQRRHQLFRSRK